MLRNCKFRDGVRFAFFEPQAWAHGGAPTQFQLRIGFVAPVIDCPHSHPKDVVFCPRRGPQRATITYSPDLEDLLSKHCYFEPRLIDPRVAVDIDWIRRLTVDLHEFQTYGTPPVAPEMEAENGVSSIPHY